MLKFLAWAVRRPRTVIAAARCAVDVLRVAYFAERLTLRVSLPGNADRTAALEHSPTVLFNVHPVSECGGRPCPLHSRSDHPMRTWPQHWREDRGFIERLCRHGVGHPDPDDPHAPEAHGCEGCCRKAWADAFRCADVEGKFH